jgi:N4-gp56 family major capsid protein
MAFTTVMTTAADVDDSIVLEFDQQFIVQSAQEAVMDQFVSYKKSLNSKSIQLPKYDRLALSTTPLVESDDVASEALVDSQILLTPAEYGNVVTRTKLAQLQSGGTADLAAARLVGLNAGRSTDKLAVLAAEASTNELFSGQTSEGAITATDVMSPSFLNKIYNKLSRDSVMPLSDGMYVAVMHDDQIHDLREGAGSGSWQDINKYSRPEEVLRNEVGQIAGFKIVRNNNITVNADAGLGAVDTYNALCMGFNALGKAESQGLELRLTGPFDKLARFVNVGWHWVGQYKIVDQDAMYLGTSASSVGANV